MKQKGESYKPVCTEKVIHMNVQTQIKICYGPHQSGTSQSSVLSSLH